MCGVWVQVAELDEHFNLLHNKGVTVDNLKDLTTKQLEEFGMTKFMHRKRFLRYSADMHRKLEEDRTAAEKKEKWDEDKKKFDAKKRMEKASKSTHNFAMQCTEYGRKNGAC